jgi:hypothetical protein
VTAGAWAPRGAEFRVGSRGLRSSDRTAAPPADASVDGTDGDAERLRHGLARLRAPNVGDSVCGCIEALIRSVPGAGRRARRRRPTERCVQQRARPPGGCLENDWASPWDPRLTIRGTDRLSAGGGAPSAPVRVASQAPTVWDDGGFPARRWRAGTRSRRSPVHTGAHPRPGRVLHPPGRFGWVSARRTPRRNCPVEPPARICVVSWRGPRTRSCGP